MISGCIALHGFGWMQVYFQVGMIIGDTEQHNEICGFRGGNGLHRQHMSHDCNVTSDVVITHLINLQVSLTDFSCTFNIRIVCIITGHIVVVTHVLPM